MIPSLKAAFPEGDFESHPIRLSAHLLRFELGDDLDLKSIERIDQAVARASTLFAKVFDSAKSLTVMIDDYDGIGPEMHATKPAGVLTKILPGFSPNQYTRQTWPNCEISPQRQIFECPTALLDHRGLFRGIANRELGRLPRINQVVYLMDLERGVIFHMYDDRGFWIGFADPAAKAQHATKHVDWHVVPVVA